MKKVFLVALMFPMSAFAFTPVPVESCIIDAQGKSDGFCEVRKTLEMALNDSGGDLHYAIKNCTFVIGMASGFSFDMTQEYCVKGAKSLGWIQ